MRALCLTQRPSTVKVKYLQLQISGEQFGFHSLFFTSLGNGTTQSGEIASLGIKTVEKQNVPYPRAFCFRIPLAAMMPVATVMPDDTPMFDPSILHELDWSENTTTFSPAISPLEPGDGLVMRPLCTADVNRGRIPFHDHHKQKLGAALANTYSSVLSQ